MKHQRRILVGAAAGLAVALSAITISGVSAHPERGNAENQISFEELFPGEGVAQDKQHDDEAGHLPPKQENVELIGKAEVTNPSGAGNTGRIADVAAWGNYAFLNAFRDPVCEQAGVHVIDISDVSNPFEVTEAFIPTSDGSYAGEGVKVIPIAGMDVLIHQNELCPGAAPAPGASGGINLWDVSDPTNPVNLAMHQGDNTGEDGEDQGFVNDSHSYDVWTNNFTGKTYAALIDNFEFADVDILDISDPRNPVLVNDTLDLVHATQQETPDTLTSVFSHDMDVQRFGNRYIMSLAYWDGGYVLLDVTDPAPGNVVIMAESDFALLDEERLARGHQIEPEGNAHQSELTPHTGRHMLATDEDFNPFRVFATITSGVNTGSEFIAAQASATPPLTEENTPLTGTPTFVGLACDPLPAGTGVALVERGVCPFQQKLDVITAAGYSAGIVFNSVNPTCLALVTMLAEGDIPFIFVNRAVGLQILDQAVSGDAACTTPTPSAPTPAEIHVEAVFDGWGYVRLFATKFSHGAARGGDRTASLTQLDTYAVPESQDPAFGVGFGDLSVHEVAIDPSNPKLAYISYYAAGLRVVTFGNNGIHEVGAFIDEGGNNFWGVEVHEVAGEQVVLASDRDHGLYIFRYTGP